MYISKKKKLSIKYYNRSDTKKNTKEICFVTNIIQAKKSIIIIIII